MSESVLRGNLTHAIGDQEKGAENDTEGCGVGVDQIQQAER
jgi:hypothetical protein